MDAPPHWLTPEQQAAWDSFIRMQEKLIGRLSRQVQADSRMSPADYIVLAKLTEAGGRMRFMDLTKLVEWEKSRMSHQVGRMAKRGLVTKEDCPDDGRGAFIVATPAKPEGDRGRRSPARRACPAAVHRGPDPGRAGLPLPHREPRPDAHGEAARLTCRGGVRRV